MFKGVKGGGRVTQGGYYKRTGGTVTLYSPDLVAVQCVICLIFIMHCNQCNDFHNEKYPEKSVFSGRMIRQSINTV